MDRLKDYVIKHSSCSMPRCKYVENDIEIDCDRCQEIMIAEHDKQIRANAIDEVIKVLEKRHELGELDYEVIERIERLKDIK